jgi:hypothetical protein
MMEQTDRTDLHAPQRWKVACYWCGDRLSGVSDGDVTDPRYRAALADHQAVCPRHPQRLLEDVLARWRATGDPTRAACADEIAAVCSYAWTRPHFSEL